MSRPAIVLASRSPRRSQLLCQIGVPHEVLAVDFDEARLPAVVDGASGFLYYVAVQGVTGTKSAAVDHVREARRQLLSRKAPVPTGWAPMSSP